MISNSLGAQPKTSRAVVGLKSADAAAWPCDLIEVYGANELGFDSAQYAFQGETYSFQWTNTGVTMSELSESNAAIVNSSAAEAAQQLSEAKKRALHFVVGAQEVMLEVIVFVGSELLERARSETHLLSEFVSKMAGSHSVKGFETMYRDCSQHQLDFIRRDCDRLFTHGERMLEVTSKLFSKPLQS